jgi:hypothetical protein
MPIPWQTWWDEMLAIFYPFLASHCTWTTPQVEGCLLAEYRALVRTQRISAAGGPGRKRLHDRRTNVIAWVNVKRIGTCDEMITCWPRHILGPALNGRNMNGLGVKYLCSRSSMNRSGSNTSASTTVTFVSDSVHTETHRQDPISLSCDASRKRYSQFYIISSVRNTPELQRVAQAYFVFTGI